eukprot:sb/3469451/
MISSFKAGPPQLPPKQTPKPPPPFVPAGTFDPKKTGKNRKNEEKNFCPCPITNGPFEIELRASDRTIFQTILDRNNTSSKNKQFIFIVLSHHFLLNRQYTKCIILIQNCLKNRSITDPKLYLKRKKFYSRFKFGKKRRVNRVLDAPVVLEVEDPLPKFSSSSSPFYRPSSRGFDTFGPWRHSHLVGITPGVYVTKVGPRFNGDPDLPDTTLSTENPGKLGSGFMILYLI